MDTTIDTTFIISHAVLLSYYVYLENAVSQPSGEGGASSAAAAQRRHGRAQGSSPLTKLLQKDLPLPNRAGFYHNDNKTFTEAPKYLQINYTGS